MMSMTQTRQLFALVLIAVSLAGCAEFNPARTAGAGTDADVGTIDDFAVNYDPQTVEYFNNVVTNTVYFDVDQSRLSPDGESALIAQAEWLNSNPAYTLTIEGHADERGTREYNLGLGARRAETVRNFLITRNVADSRIETVSYGKERPFAACSDESCWSLNRRGVTIVTGG